MALEKDLNKKIQAAIADLHPFRIENSVGPGTPDIGYVGGYIEDKQFGFPVRPGTIVKCDHYVDKQRAWHVKHRRAGGCCLVAVGDSRSGRTYVFDALDAAAHFGIDWDETAMRRAAKLFLEAWDARAFRKFIIEWTRATVANVNWLR